MYMDKIIGFNWKKTSMILTEISKRSAIIITIRFKNNNRRLNPNISTF